MIHIEIESENKKEFLLRKIVYDSENDGKSRYVELNDYSDAFIETILQKINEGLES